MVYTFNFWVHICIIYLAITYEVDIAMAFVFGYMYVCLYMSHICSSVRPMCPHSMLPVVICITNVLFLIGGTLKIIHLGFNRPSTSYFLYYLNIGFGIRFNIF